MKIEDAAVKLLIALDPHLHKLDEETVAAIRELKQILQKSEKPPQDTPPPLEN